MPITTSLPSLTPKGPTGCGKTRFLEVMAVDVGCPLCTVACHDDTSATDLLGCYLVEGGDTVWQDGPLTLAAREGAILYLDEVTEAREDIVVVLHSLTDHRRQTPHTSSTAWRNSMHGYGTERSPLAHTLNSWKAIQMLSKARFPLMALGLLALLTALWGGLVRLGWAWPLPWPTLFIAHGPLMVCGFLGTLIGVEVPSLGVLGWSDAAPLLSATGALALLAGLPAPPLMTLGRLGRSRFFCPRHRTAPICPGHRDHGAWRVPVVGGEQLLAGGVASGAGGAVVERLPGADHRR